MQIIDMNEEVITVTDIEKALRQARFFKNLANDYQDKIYPAYQRIVAYWNDAYIKLRQLQHPGYELFHYQLRKDLTVPWECIRLIDRLMPDEEAADRLAGRLSRFYKAEVRLTGKPVPLTVNVWYYKCWR